MNIIEMARECGLTIHGELMLGVEQFAALVVAAEREACARLFDLPPWLNGETEEFSRAAAIAIRARGEKS